MSYKKDFSIFRNNKNLIYLDSAATSQKPKIVIDSISNFLAKNNSNIHRGIYSLSQKAEELYEGSRNKVAIFINAKSSSEIIFTGNTTESINLAAFGYFRKFLKRGDIVVLSEIEHHSNIVPWLILKKLLGIKLYYLSINQNYELDYQSFLKDDIDFKKVKLISLTHASNVLGTINPLETIIPLLKRGCVNSKILIDAAQSIPHIRINVQALECDFLAFSSHKMFGPSGVGVLYAKSEILNEMSPLFYGGHMISQVTKSNATFLEAPMKFEAGTGKLESVVGLGAAIDYIDSLSIKSIQKYEKTLTKYAIAKLSKIKNVQIYGNTKLNNRLPIFTFNLKGVHAHDLAEILNRSNVSIRAGHHCAQVLMNVLKVEATARASFSIYNTTQDVDGLITAIGKAIKVFKI